MDGGTEISLQSIPSTVSIRKDNNHICVGNLLTLTHVLSVARCIYKIKIKGRKKNSKHYDAWVGMFNGAINHLVLEIKNVYIHEDFDSSVSTTSTSLYRRPIENCIKCRKNGI